tara:strand:+ start:1144 stop:2043 length:900 start_codon:yes stop_codon:yes gene_type:complete
MKIFDSFITKSIPHLPKWFAKPFSKPYVAGETVEEALSKIKHLNSKGFSATIDILGEHTEDTDIARDITHQYCNLYEQIENNGLDSTISVKPTHVGLSISKAEAVSNMLSILKKAKEFGNFLRIDMEDSNVTDQTFEIYMECKKMYDRVGVVIQAYLYRSENDIDTLANDQFNSRICKGIYKESKTIAYQDREDIRNNFLLLAKSMANKASFCGYATHDQPLIDRLLDWVESEKIDPHLFEFQSLFGVPMNGRLEQLVEKGFRVRIYVPFGPDWFDYSLRRLKENPDIAGYVISNLFKK